MMNINFKKFMPNLKIYDFLREKGMERKIGQKHINLYMFV